MAQMEVLVRVSPKNPKAKAAGKSQWDVISAKLPNSSWGRAEIEGDYRVVLIDVESPMEVAAYEELLAQSIDPSRFGQEPQVILPFAGDYYQSVIRIDCSAVNLPAMARRRIEKAHGYVKRSAPTVNDAVLLPINPLKQKNVVLRSGQDPQRGWARV